MHCHLNCHGELTMLYLAIPVITGALLRGRAILRGIVQRVRGRS